MEPFKGFNLMCIPYGETEPRGVLSYEVWGPWERSMWGSPMRDGGRWKCVNGAL
jgi:hypothetical protein